MNFLRNEIITSVQKCSKHVWQDGFFSCHIHADPFHANKTDSQATRTETLTKKRFNFPDS